MERDDAGILRTVDRRPGDPLIRELLGDARLPGPLLAGDARLPTEGRVVELLDLLDALHEHREAFELGPLVVRRPDRHGDIDRFHDLRHESLLSFWPLNRNAHHAVGVPGCSVPAQRRHPRSDRAAT